MMFYDHTEKLPKYSSYKKEAFEKYKGKAKSLLYRIQETSLKKEDKERLIEEIIIIAGQFRIQR